MNTYLKIVSYIALIGLIFIPILFLEGIISTETNKTLILIFSILWFGSAPFWMLKAKDQG